MDQGSDYINNSPDVVVVRRRQVLYEQQLFYYLGDPRMDIIMQLSRWWLGFNLNKSPQLTLREECGVTNCLFIRVQGPAN